MMASFENIVRPVVFPNIRPAPARSLPPEDDPTKGFAVISGNPARTVNFTYSYSFNASSGRQKEAERRVDEVRIYQMDDDGTVNRSNFIDVDIANRLQMQGSKGPGVNISVEEFPGEGQARIKEEWRETYKPVEEADNIEIRDRNVIKKNED